MSNTASVPDGDRDLAEHLAAAGAGATLGAACLRGAAFRSQRASSVRLSSRRASSAYFFAAEFLRDLLRDPASTCSSMQSSSSAFAMRRAYSERALHHDVAVIRRDLHVLHHDAGGHRRHRDRAEQRADRGELAVEDELDGRSRGLRRSCSVWFSMSSSTCRVNDRLAELERRCA